MYIYHNVIPKDVISQNVISLRDVISLDVEFWILWI